MRARPRFLTDRGRTVLAGLMTASVALAVAWACAAPPEGSPIPATTARGR